MAHPIKTYVRPLRRRSGLTQKELAFLLGAKSGTIVSRIEGVKRAPNLSAMLAYMFVFGAAPAELFPGLLSQIHEDVRGRVNELYEAIQGNPAKTTRTKLDFLETVQARLEGTGKAHDV
jgi:transcriptional regulator with XRE-family HTH domain